MQINDKLHDVQKIELEILEVVHKVCIENHLRYSLAYGTLIGAIRHKGFIPWDDDIDICMPREDYERFLEVWPKYNFENYLLQNKFTDSDFTQSFTKIRKEHTIFLQPGEEKCQYHKGIFIDIFPGDRVPASKIKRKIQFINIAVSLLYTRGHKSGSQNRIISLTEDILLKRPKEKFAEYAVEADRRVQRYNGKSNLEYVFASTISSAKNYYPSDIFEHLILAEFEGKQFYIYRDYDKCLRVEYGDYMQLPPENERTWKHTPQMIDFEYNYEERLNRKANKNR